MVNDGWATDFRDAFDRYLGNGKVAFVQKDRLPLVDAIAMIHRAGGLAVLAHPGPTGSRARIEVLAAAGLDGVEVRHPGHSAEDTARLSALADHFGLVPSGGSDWHGATEGSRRLGMMDVPLEWLRHQEERLSSRARVVGAGDERVA
jgi:predicted metal-dependent phosphoesterase TrpH